MAERQTLSYLQSSFQRARIQPRTQLGQNFLIDLNLVRLIADTAQLTKRDVVLEVGTGMGSLTSLLAERAARVVTVEIDPQLAALAQGEIDGWDNVTLLTQDALKSKHQFHPRVLETVRREFQSVPGARLKLVANLPYNVATPVLSNFLHFDPWPHQMVATIQRELAQRICAQPRTKDYGALSIWMQSQCRTEIARIMPPDVFWPRPKVESAIVAIYPQKVLRDRIADRSAFHDLVRKIFLHRRKYLRSALHSAAGGHLSKFQVDRILEELEIGAQARAEELTPQQFIELAERILRESRPLSEGSKTDD